MHIAQAGTDIEKEERVRWKKLCYAADQLPPHPKETNRERSDMWGGRKDALKVEHQNSQKRGRKMIGKNENRQTDWLSSDINQNLLLHEDLWVSVYYERSKFAFSLIFLANSSSHTVHKTTNCRLLSEI